MDLEISGLRSGISDLRFQISERGLAAMRDGSGDFRSQVRDLGFEISDAGNTITTHNQQVTNKPQNPNTIYKRRADDGGFCDFVIYVFARDLLFGIWSF
jgi:hypothetical protein